ncbi:MAG TPA: MBG domain-containing protein, partial [Planctomycetota bacterium]|nr:MBG domain-containing protein [Planctomycetota bacterium]
PGQIQVGDLVRFSNHTDLYTVATVTGYPHTSITLTSGLTTPVPATTVVQRTTGFTVTAIGAVTNASDLPNDLGSSTFSITGSATLTPGSSIAFAGSTESYQIIAVAGSPTSTSITVRPKVVSIPAVGAYVDRLTVIGNEQPPVMDFSRNGATAFSAIIGGYIYRGSELPGLVGKYIFADNQRGTVYSLENLTSVTPTLTPLFTMPSYATFDANGYRGIGGFGVDQNNELLICRMQVNGAATNTSSGQIWKIIRDSSTVIGTPIPTDLKDTGAFALDGNGTVSSMTPAPSLIPYDVNAALWSDGAYKQRWIALPDGATADFAATGAWTFPAGTVFVKHFELDDYAFPGHRRRLETRLLVRRSDDDEVYGVTYKWNTAGTQATLVASAGLSETYTITEADGMTTHSQTWNYPSRNDCLYCHNTNASHVLGVSTRQLNGSYTYASTGITDNQLHTWAHIGMFTTPPADNAIGSLTHLSNIADTAATPEQRTRSWIDANCSHCHRPNNVHALFDARFDTPLRQQHIVDGDVLIDLGTASARVIARGDVSSSIMHRRDNSLDPAIKMPPLAKNLVHTQAMSVMQDWISSLPYATNPVLTGLAQTYDGTPKPVTATAATDGVPTIAVMYSGTSVTYPLSSTPPTNAGTYAVQATLASDLLYSGSTSDALVISKATAPIALTGLTPTYDGSAKVVTVNATPSGLPVTITYGGGATAPSTAGSYVVVATINHANYQGTISSTLMISKATATVNLQ